MKTSYILGGSFLAIALVFGMSAIGANNSANQMEKSIVAKRDDVDQVLANYGQKLQEAAQVPDMATDDLERVMKAAFEGRYGENGSQAAFQWIQENYPGQVDPGLYRQIQQIVESGRNDFVAAQRGLIDEKRVYLTSLDTIPGGWLKRMMGYPTINVGYKGGKDDFKVIITNRAAKARETGREDAPIQIRSKSE